MKMDLVSESLSILGYKSEPICFNVCVLPSKWFYHLPGDSTSVWVIQIFKGLSAPCVIYYAISPVKDKSND